MKNPMHEAISRRRQHGLDLSSYHAQDPQAASQHPAKGAVDDALLDSDLTSQKLGAEDQKGDLAPEVGDEQDLELHQDQPSPDQERAIHAKEGVMPEHHDLPHPGGPAIDPEVEAHLMSGHNGQLQRPKSLGARVMASLHSQKGSK